MSGYISGESNILSLYHIDLNNIKSLADLVVSIYISWQSFYIFDSDVCVYVLLLKT